MKYPYEDLEVWQEAVQLSKEVYRVTQSFPKEEMYGMTSQVRRSALSVALNIAEGRGRWHKKEFIHFLFIARGSLFETKTLLEFAEEFGYISKEKYTSLSSASDQVMRKLSGLINHLKE